MNPPTTVQGLIDWFEETFVCVDGPARAFFEISTGPDSILRFVYETHALLTYDVAEAEAKLVGAMWADFCQIATTPAMGTTLFWRLKNKVELVNNYRDVLGDVIATREEIEDGIKERPVGADVFEDEYGNFFKSLGRKQEWKLRTRLVIPAMQWFPAGVPMLSRKSEVADVAVI